MADTEKGYRFNAFKGVFTPNILTILGVIMYLRFGWVLGNVGLFRTLVIVTLSTLITLITSLSISVLATNMRLRGGGAYYIISRSLGIEAGAAIGLPLYVAQTLGVSFYVIGFAESLSGFLPWPGIQEMGVITLVIISILALISADFALKIQYIILMLIGASLVSFFMGSSEGLPAVISQGPVPQQEKFWAVFAVFFPAVTGILSGLSMSGDLANPKKAIPRGTLCAVGISYLIYMAIPIFLSRIISDPSILLTDSMIMYKTARWGNLILAGLWGASLSSAIASLLGGPRTLQAMARDRVTIQVFGRGFGKNAEPRLAMLISFIVALAGTFAGDLNVIAAILTMFFLTTYGLLNLSAGLGNLISSPSWRPEFTVHWGVSFTGAFACFAAMFMIDAGSTFLALFISVSIFLYMKNRSIRANQGDMKYAIIVYFVQYALYTLSWLKPHGKTWRPNMLVFSGSPSARWHLIETADAIAHGLGMLTIASVVSPEHITGEREVSMETTMRNYIAEKNIRAFVKVYPAEDTFQGMETLIRGYGFGPLEPNTVFLGDVQKNEHLIPYIRLVKMIRDNRRNLIVLREGAEKKVSVKAKRIDVWWGRKSSNIGLILALAYLLRRSPAWRDAQLNLKTIVNTNDEIEAAEKGLQEFIDSAHLNAVAETISAQEGSAYGLIKKHSAEADFVFLGIRSPEEAESNEEYSTYYRDIIFNTVTPATTAYVMASEDLDFREIFSELA
jgi:amino acid transporter